MQGITFKEVRKLNEYGYRILIDDDHEVCSVFEIKEKEKARKIADIFFFDDKGLLKISFCDELDHLRAKWVLIRPKCEEDGIVFLYEDEEDGLSYGKEILA